MLFWLKFVETNSLYFVNVKHFVIYEKRFNSRFSVPGVGRGPNAKHERQKKPRSFGEKNEFSKKRGAEGVFSQIKGSI